MRPLYLCLLVALQFTIITINYRAIAQARYAAAILTDALIAVCGFTLFKLIAASSGVYDMAGYVSGACVGSVLGIWLTRTWKQAE